MVRSWATGRLDGACAIRVNDGGTPDLVARSFIAASAEITFDYAMRTTPSTTSLTAVAVARSSAVRR